MRSQCIQTLRPGKVNVSLSRSSTFAIRCQSTRLLHLPPWLARSYAWGATAAKPSQLEEDRPSSVDCYTPHKQRALAQSEVFSQTSLKQELRYLTDPRKLADYILTLLRKDQIQKAYELVKISSGDLPCTVSWNHLIDFEMSQGRVGNACKIYNDMKKRAQQPDAKTYTLLLRGLATFPQYPQSLARALSLYQSMYADNCPVKPSIIHINAVLKVCARCEDIDALLGIAAKLPTHGAGAPDNLTFTTILNAIRTNAWRGVPNNTPEAKAEIRHRASMQGRKIWWEIIGRWEKGDIKIDEELVCSMGRLLLIADSEKTCMDILSLVAQTMGIQQPKSLAQMSPRGLGESNAPEDASNISDETVGPPSLNGPISDPDKLPDDVPRSEFYPLSEKNSKRRPFAQAGRNTLSMVLDTCIRLRAIAAAQDYWGLLTDPDGPHKIVPDSENYHMFLRLLRVQRASRLALGLVRDMRRGPFGSEPIKLEPKTFRIALSACARDTKNPNVMESAGALARMMLDTLPTPDIKSLELYLHVAMFAEKENDWVALMSVLKGSVLGVRNLRSQVLFTKREEGSQSVYNQDVVRLIKKLISAFDITISRSNGIMGPRDYQECVGLRNTLTTWVTWANHRRRRDPLQLRDGDNDRATEDVDTGSNTSVETQDQISFDQKSRQAAQPTRPEEKPLKTNVWKLRNPSLQRPTLEGGAGARRRRMALLDKQRHLT